MNIIKKANNEIVLQCQKCIKSISEKSLYCAKCRKNINVANLNVQLKEKKIERVKIVLDESETKPIYLCPKGSIFKDLRLSLFKTFKGRPSDFLIICHGENGEEKTLHTIIPTYVKFR